MSFLHIAGFDFHGAAAADFDRYDPTPTDVTWESASGKFGGGNLRVLTNTNNIKRTVSTTVQREGWAAFYMKRAIDANDNAEFFLIGGTSGAIHFWIEVGNSDRKSGPTDHQIILLNQNDTLLGTSINTFTGSESSPSEYFHMEVFWKLGQGDGEFKLWVDDNLEIDVSSLTLGQPVTSLDDWRHWRSEGVQGFLRVNDSVRLDDLVIQDVGGARLGAGHRVWTSLPDSDTSSEFTPSTGGDNFAMVDDAVPDQDATYVESTGVDDRDVYGHTPPTIVGKVEAVVVKTLARRASGSGDIKLGVELSASELLSAAISPDGTLWEDQEAIFETKPGGGGWVAADIANTDLIIEATTANVRVSQAWLEILTTILIPPVTPTITIGNVDEEEVTLDGNAFVAGDPGTHTASQWQVTLTADTSFASVVFDSGVDPSSLLSILATGLTHNTGYIARVRYQDSNGAFSAYSATAGFTTDTKLGTPAIAIVGTTFSTVSVTSDAFVPGDDGDPHEQTNWQLTLSTDPTFATPIVDTITADPFKLLAFMFFGLDLFLNSYLVRVRYRDDTVWSDWSSSKATSAIAAGQYYTAYAEPDLADDMDDRAAIDWDEVWADDESTWIVLTDLTATCLVLVERVQETGGAPAVDPIFFQAFTPVDKQIVLARFKFDEIGTGSVTCLSGISSPLGKICRISTGFVRRDQFDDLSEWIVVRGGSAWGLAVGRGHLDAEGAEQLGSNALAFNYAASTGPNALIVWNTAGIQPVDYWFQAAVKVADVLEQSGQALWWRTGWPGLAFNVNAAHNKHYSTQNAHNCGLFATWVFQVFYRHFGGAFALLDTFDATGRPFGASLSYNIGDGGYEYMKVGWHSEKQEVHMAFSSQRGLQISEHRLAFDVAHESGKVGLVVNGCMKGQGSGLDATILFDSAVICKGNKVETQLVPEDYTVEINHDSILEAFDIADEIGVGVDTPIFNDFEGNAWPATDITVLDADDVLVESWPVPVTADAPVGIWGGDVFQLNLGGIGVGPIAGPAARLSGTAGGSLGSGYFAYLNNGTQLVLAKGDNVGGLVTLGTFAYIHGPGVYYNVVIKADGTTLQAKVFTDSEGDPGAWQITVVDSTYPTGAPGQVALSTVTVGFDVLAMGIGGEALPTGRNPSIVNWILPTGDKWFGPSDTSLNISWGLAVVTPPPMGIDNVQYEVEYKDTAGSDAWIPLVIQSGTTFTWDISGLVREHPHCLRVRTLAGCEKSPYTEICEVSELSIGVNCDDYEVIWLSRPELNDLETDFVAGETHQYARRFKGIPVGTTFPTAQLTVTVDADTITPLVQKSSTPVDNGDGSMDVTITLTSAETILIGDADAKVFELLLTDNLGDIVIPNAGLILARAARISI